MKQLKNFWKSGGFWIGPFLIVMGLSAAFVSGSWLPVPAALAIAGIVILGLWLLFQGRLVLSFLGKRSTQAGTNAVAATLSVLVILGLMNFLANRYLVRVDLTENQLFSLAPQTQQLVSNLEQPVKVSIFDRVPNPSDQLLLQNYQRSGGSKFSYEYVDPQLQPAIAQEYGVTRFGEVHLKSNERQQFLGNVDPQSRLTEVKLTNGIAQLISDEKTKVYFLQGHGERSLKPADGGIYQAVKSLENRNFIIEPLNLAEQQDVPADAGVVVIAGPKRALFEGESKALRQYLQLGGSVLVMVDPSTDPKLNTLLQDWGVTLDNRLVIDASGQGQLVGLGPAEPLITNYGNHPITKDFSGGYSFYRGARSIQTNEVPGIEETPLLITNERSWAESNPKNQPLKFNAETDGQGPLMLGVALSRKIAQDGVPAAQPSPAATDKPKAEASPSPTPTASPATEASPSPTPTESPATEASPSPTPTALPAIEASPTPTVSPASPTPTPTPTPTPAAGKPAQTNTEARMVVFGNSEFATDGVFEQQLNGDVFLNSISWLSKQDAQTLSIRPKETTNRRIAMTAEQASLLDWLSRRILPAVGLLSAGALWWSRR
ncbi:GldG family protein [Microcoleus sp. FACHB-672]|uniref:GldG family protein n=1 Tax=Microcoleus sp. FACHB-672 TaxID=2692825 RepID=UPI001684A0C0|nr:Gldg family protein [Microcoleus sp. FACHB-672]MBD2042549.1 Gldg family protein [Microcoleus sp. FACHB-672]